jgi:hypothetical protein
MTDKELLKDAAKAAGFEVVFYGNECVGVGISDCKRDWPWNPLTDDGDALRLAVKLKMPINVTNEIARCIWGSFGNGERCDEWHSNNGDDPYAATRRAITRAAAEIGKAMKS